MAFFNRYKKYVFISGVIWAACLMLSILTYFLVLGPQIQARKRLESEFAEKKQTYEFAQNAAKEETKKRLRQRIEELQNKLGLFVINSEDSANLSFDISQIASEKKVTALTVENKKSNRAGPTVTDPNNIFESHISVSFIAGFQQFATFLNALERNKPVLFVKEFTIALSNRKDSAYQVKLDVTALVRKQQVSQQTKISPERVVGAEYEDGKISEMR
jgi:Tfp pilus assembly protein PilO